MSLVGRLTASIIYKHVKRYTNFPIINELRLQIWHFRELFFEINQKWVIWAQNENTWRENKLVSRHANKIKEFNVVE